MVRYMIFYETHRSSKGEYLYNQFDKNLNFQKHTHCSYEIVFCLGGCLICEVGNTEYELHKGDGLLILPGYIHSYRTPEKAKTIFVFFLPILFTHFTKKQR